MVRKDFLEFIKSRRSIRKLEPRPIPKEEIEEILEVAITAPSAHNAQPWRFVVITNNEVKLLLAESMSQAWRKDLLEDSVQGVKIEELVRKSIKRIMSASLVVVVCCSMKDMHNYPDENRQRIERIMAIQSVSAAIENLLLAAQAKGLGACWLCAPLFCAHEVRKALDIPVEVTPLALIEMGQPSAPAESRLRKPLKDVVYYNGWFRSP